MRKFILAILMAMTLPAMADSGVLYDAERPGEGLIWIENGSYVVAFIFTYGKTQCDGFAGSGIWLEEICNRNGQRWLMISGDKMVGDEVSGFLYSTEGLSYPTGIPDPENPFAQLVAEPIAVGIYYAQRSGEGWKILVLPFGTELDPDDVIFDRVWNFTTSLFPAD